MNQGGVHDHRENAVQYPINDVYALQNIWKFAREAGIEVLADRTAADIQALKQKAEHQEREEVASAQQDADADVPMQIPACTTADCGRCNNDG